MIILQNYNRCTPQELAIAIDALGEISKSKGPNSALYQRIKYARIKHNEDHDTSLSIADFAKNVLGVTVKVSNQTLNQHGIYSYFFFPIRIFPNNCFFYWFRIVDNN